MDTDNPDWIPTLNLYNEDMNINGVPDFENEIPVAYFAETVYDEGQVDPLQLSEVSSKVAI